MDGVIQIHAPQAETFIDSEQPFLLLDHCPSCHQLKSLPAECKDGLML